MEKFLIASIALMLLFYAMAVPFVNYYNGLDRLSEIQQEKALVAEMQMTISVGSAIILFLLLAGSIFWKKYKIPL